MDVTGRADLELYHRALEDVNKLFLLINTLSVCHREMVFCKLKQQLSNYDVDSFKSGNLNGTLHKTTVVENRVSSRPKKLTAKAQILFDEARTQMLEEKAKKKNDSFNGIASVMPGTVRPCFVKLVPIHDSSDTLIGGQEIISRPIVKLPGMKAVYNDTGGYNAEEDVDNPVWNNQDIINDSPRKRYSSRKNKKSWKMDNNNEQKCDKHFKCNKCGKSFSQKGGLDIHLKRHFGVKSFACALCEYKAVCKVEILRHMAKHTGERNHPCKMCGKNFTSDCSLRNHIRNVHERSENSVCAHCSFETHSKDILRRHYLIKHTKDEQFECPVCHEVIKQKGTFMVHMRRHTGERPYQCAVCTKPFRSSSQLAAHKRTHRPGEYSCSVCSRHFKTKHQLSRHRIIHTGEKPYTCHLCSYACNVKANITKHVRAVHKLNSFTFKEPRSTGSSDNSDALQRGHKAADEYLQEHTVKVGEILTVEDLQRQSREQMEYQEKTKLDECKESPNTAVDLLVPEHTLSTSNGCPSSSVTRLGMCENINDGIGTSSSCLVDTCTSDILSSAVQLLNSSVQDVDGCDSQYKTVNETVSIPVEIGQNMYIIQVVPDQNVSL